MTTKKICFLVAFLAFLMGVSAQTVDKQKGNGEKIYYVKIERYLKKCQTEQKQD